MSNDIEAIVNNIKEIYFTDSSLEILLDFERVIDELDVYVFANWIKGELVQGPIIKKYFVTCTFMYPYKMMPDPRGGVRLLDYKCQITYTKKRFDYPVSVQSQADFEPGSRMPRLTSKPVWLVEITMPKNLIKDIQRGSLELESEKIDLEDLDNSYEAGLDDEVDQGQSQSDTQSMPDANTNATPRTTPQF